MTCCSNRILGIVTVIGALLVALTAVSFPLLDAFIRRKVIQEVILVNGSQTYAMWEAPTVPIYIQFYVFDLQNAAEVLESHKPFVEQKGPYTYREHRRKVDIVKNANGTLTYRQMKWYHFDRSMSVGPDTDSFTTVNMPLMTLAEALKWEPRLVKSLAAILLKAFDEQLFVSKTVRDMVMGYEDPLLSMGKELDPTWFYTDRIGILAGKNDTDDGVYTIFSGETDATLVGIIDKYNGSSSLKFWTSPTANMINGSDGTLAPPFINKNKRLHLFASDICRSVYGTFHGDVKSPEGIPLYRYTCPSSVLDGGSPDNAGFCTPKGHCMGTGVFNITTCQRMDSFPVPMIVSFPHFYLADVNYTDAIGNLHPDPKQHATEASVEPHTGLVMQIAKRLQLNLYMEHSPHIRQLFNVRSMVYPILWLNESATLDAAHARQVQWQLLVPIQVIYVLQLVLLSVGALLFLCSVAALITRRCRCKTDLDLPGAEEADDNAPLMEDQAPHA